MTPDLECAVKRYERVAGVLLGGTALFMITSKTFSIASCLMRRHDVCASTGQSKGGTDEVNQQTVRT